MQWGFLVLGLLFVLVGLGVRVRAKFLSEGIDAVGFLLLAILLVVAGLMFWRM